MVRNCTTVHNQDELLFLEKNKEKEFHLKGRGKTHRSTRRSFVSKKRKVLLRYKTYIYGLVERKQPREEEVGKNQSITGW